MIPIRDHPPDRIIIFNLFSKNYKNLNLPNILIQKMIANEGRFDDFLLLLFFIFSTVNKNKLISLHFSSKLKFTLCIIIF